LRSQHSPISAVVMAVVMAALASKPRLIFSALGAPKRAPPSSFPSLLRLGTRGRRLPPPLPTHHNALQLLVPLLLGMGTTTACSDDDTEPRPFFPFHGILQCKIGGEIFPPLLFQPITVPLAQLVPSLSLPGTPAATIPTPPVATTQKKRKRGGQAKPRCRKCDNCRYIQKSSKSGVKFPCTGNHGFQYPSAPSLASAAPPPPTTFVRGNLGRQIESRVDAQNFSLLDRCAPFSLSHSLKQMLINPPHTHIHRHIYIVHTNTHTSCAHTPPPQSK